MPLPAPALTHRLLSVTACNARTARGYHRIREADTGNKIYPGIHRVDYTPARIVGAVPVAARSGRIRTVTGGAVRSVRTTVVRVAVVMLHARYRGNLVVNTRGGVDVGHITRGVAHRAGRRRRSIPGGRGLVVVTGSRTAGAPRGILVRERRSLAVRTIAAAKSLLETPYVRPHQVHCPALVLKRQSRLVVRVALRARIPVVRHVGAVAVGVARRGMAHLAVCRSNQRRRSAPVVCTIRCLGLVVAVHVRAAQRRVVIGTRARTSVGLRRLRSRGVPGENTSVSGIEDVHTASAAQVRAVIRRVTRLPGTRMAEGADGGLLPLGVGTRIIPVAQVLTDGQHVVVMSAHIVVGVGRTRVVPSIVIRPDTARIGSRIGTVAGGARSARTGKARLDKERAHTHHVARTVVVTGGVARPRSRVVVQVSVAVVLNLVGRRRVVVRPPRVRRVRGYVALGTRAVRAVVHLRAVVVHRQSSPPVVQLAVAHAASGIAGCRGIAVRRSAPLTLPTIVVRMAARRARVIRVF